MVSYAQNGEDVVLARAFPEERPGFYVDVGASDPEVDSVTRHFYEQGWSGVNVEPTRVGIEALRRDRPRDVNLAVGAGREPGALTLFELPVELTGCSTFSEELAAGYESDGWEVERREVPIQTLAQICAEHVGERTIDFLKIDVEGDEEAVLAGADFGAFRPRVVVVEATRPGTAIPSHEAWEGALLGSGYRLVLFDGLNRFYLREEDAELTDLLSVPANVHDGFVPARCEAWRVDAAESHRRAGEANARAEALEAALGRTRAQLAESQAALRDARAEREAYRVALDASRTSPAGGGGQPLG